MTPPRPGRSTTLPAPATILLTGFGPFPGVAVNASSLLVPRLAGAAAARWPSLRVVGEVLPTEWRVVPPRIGDLLARHRPVLALHFGVAREAKGFEIETVGRNRCRLAIDAAGVVPALDRLLEDGADTHATNLPVERIVERLTALGLPACASGDAGGYLCNALLYHSLRHAETLNPAMRAGFVHMPACLAGEACDGSAPPPDCPLTWAEAVAGGLEIIDVVMQAAPTGAACGR